MNIIDLYEERLKSEPKWSEFAAAKPLNLDDREGKQ